MVRIDGELRHQDSSQLPDVNASSLRRRIPLPRNEAEIIRLSPRQREVAVFQAQGFSAEEIGEKFEISRESVRTHMRELRKKTGSSTAVEVTIKLILGGNIEPEEVLQDFDVRRFGALTTSEQDTVRALVRDEGRWSTNKQIAKHLYCDVETVRTRMNHISRKLGTKGREHIAGLVASAFLGQQSSQKIAA